MAKIIISEQDWEPWGGAEDTLEKLEEASILSAFWDYIEENYPDGIDSVGLNDWLRYEEDDILEMFGVKEDEEEEEEDDEEEERESPFKEFCDSKSSCASCDYCALPTNTACKVAFYRDHPDEEPTEEDQEEMDDYDEDEDEEEEEDGEEDSPFVKFCDKHYCSDCPYRPFSTVAACKVAFYRDHPDKKPTEEDQEDMDDYGDLNDRDD